MRKNEIFTSLLVFTLSNFVLELFYPRLNWHGLWRIQPFIPSTVPARLVVSACLFFCMHFLLLSRLIWGFVNA